MSAGVRKPVASLIKFFVKVDNIEKLLPNFATELNPLSASPTK